MPPKRSAGVAIPKKFGRTETGSYFARCAALIRPFKRLAVGSAILATTVLTTYLKYTVEGNSWLFAAVNAAMIVLGISLVALSTAMIVHDEILKDSSDDFCEEPLNIRPNLIDPRKHQEDENSG